MKNLICIVLFSISTSSAVQAQQKRRPSIFSPFNNDIKSTAAGQITTANFHFNNNFPEGSATSHNKFNSTPFTGINNNFDQRLSKFELQRVPINKINNEFEKVPKTFQIDNLKPPRLNPEDGGTEELEPILEEFDYVPPSYLENREPPYNVILLTLPKDDAILNGERTEELPVFKNPKYGSKYRPTRLEAFGSELIYLQDKEEILNGEEDDGQYHEDQ